MNQANLSSKLPPIAIYSEYLHKASALLNIPINECRNRFGSYTLSQWYKLLKIENN